MLRNLGVVVGVMLLLPGVCSLGFMAAFLPEAGKPGNYGYEWPLGVLWAFCFLVSASGFLLIRNAVRGWRNRGDASSRDPPT